MSQRGRTVRVELRRPDDRVYLAGRVSKGEEVPINLAWASHVIRWVLDDGPLHSRMSYATSDGEWLFTMEVPL